MEGVGSKLAIGIVCHDAGGAEILSSFCRQNPDNYLFVLEGPAKAIFESKLGKVHSDSLDFVVSNVEEVYTGTSGQANLEREALQLSKIRKIPTKSFIDHWINYQNRFQLADGTTILPETIVVGDEIACNLAHEAFPNKRVELIPNAYWKEIPLRTSQHNSFNKEVVGEPSCIYLSEGLTEYSSEREMELEDFPGDIQLLDNLVRNISKIHPKLKTINIRPHPSEKSEKFNSLIIRYPDSFILSDGKRSLINELENHDIAVGYQGMALVIALKMGLRTISLSLGNYTRFILPFQEIETIDL